MREFFNKILTRQPPKADDRVRRNFHARLRELEAEVIKEAKANERQEQFDEGSPPTSPVRSPNLKKVDSAPGSLQRKTSMGRGMLGKTHKDLSSEVNRKAGNALSHRQGGGTKSLTPSPDQPGRVSIIRRSTSVSKLPPLD